MAQTTARKLGFPQLMSRMRDANYTITSSSSASFSYPPFPWPASCSLPRTLPFRSAWEEASSATELQHPLNASSAAAAAAAEDEAAAEPKSFSNTASEGSVGDAVEAAVRRLRSVDRRLSFEPGGGTSSSIVEGVGGAPFEGSVAVAVESVDQYGDFRRSMEEMVSARCGS